MLVTSRSYEEYAAFFAFDPDEWRGARVLDCSAGASGFVAEACAYGFRAVAVDPAYATGHDALERIAADSTRRGNAIANAHADRFTWEWYGSVAARDQMRKAALATFLADRRDHPSRYVAAGLPRLPFRDGSFDLALCSHLLFTWADVLDERWHRDALRELLRVAHEVRVFPTLMQGAGDPVPFLPALVREFRGELRQVNYEFQVGGNEMLVLSL